MNTEKNVRTITPVILIVLMLSVLAAAGVIIAQCFTLRGGEESEPNTYLMAGDWYCPYDIHTNDGTQIRFDEEGGFGYACDCGSPVDDYDLYDSYTYDSQKQIITVYSFDDTIDDVEHRLLYCDQHYLCLIIDGRYAYFINEDNEPDHMPNEAAKEYIPTNAPLLTVISFDGDNNIVTLAPADYDGDAAADFEDRIYELELSPSVGLSSVEVIDDKGEITLERKELSESDHANIEDAYSGGYVEFDNNGAVKEITFYGEVIID